MARRLLEGERSWDVNPVLTMMKTEPRGLGPSERLPHRSAYEAGIQALKPPDALGPTRHLGAAHHKKYGSNVHRIKSMFLQMGTTAGAPGDASGGAGPTEALRAPERGVRRRCRGPAA